VLLIPFWQEAQIMIIRNMGSYSCKEFQLFLERRLPTLGLPGIPEKNSGRNFQGILERNF
jgi:hypothetical protein